MADTTITLYGATGVATVTPLFTFSGTIKVYVEDEYVKDLTTDVEDSIALTVGEKLEYVCSDWDSITKIDIRDDKVSGDISGWVLPASLVNFRTENTGVSGDISGWVLPAALVNFNVSNTGVSGDISGWVLPAALVNFNVSNTGVSGDISGWVLPAGLVNFYLSNTGVSGDISGWVLPAGLVNFSVHTTGVSGDISGWVLPSTLVSFYVYSTKISYDSSRAGRMRRRGAFTGITDTLTKIDFDECELNYNQVDNILADLVTCLATDNQLDLAGDNAAPTIYGLASKTILEQRGWTITVKAGRSIPMFQREPIGLWTAAMGGVPAPSNIIYDYSVAIGGAA